MNPFRDSIVASPWKETRADVSSIHASAFDACVNGIQYIRENHRSAALMIHGEAGSGKTHLLSRLRAHLAPQMATATDRAEYLYVWVRLQTSPRMIWRTLRRTLVDDWFRPVAKHRSQFDRILFHRLANIRVATGDLEPWYEYMLEEEPEGLRQLIERIADNLDLDRNTTVAFQHLAFGRHRRDLRAWLAGDSLPEVALEQMNLSTDEGTDEEREAQARQVVLMLCRLAGDGLPIVLSFDQVEALQMSPRDLDGPFAFGQLISTLHDSTSNVLLISCVQSAFFSDLQQTIRGADYARMTSLGALSLHPLNKSEAEELIAARLSSTGTSVPAEAADRACWPLDPAQFAEILSRSDLTPRKLIRLCAEQYEVLQNPKVAAFSVNQPDTKEPPASPLRRSVGEFLADTWNALVDQTREANTPDLTEDIIRHGLPLLARLLVADRTVVRDELLREVPLVFEGSHGRIGVSVRTESNMGSIGSKFGHLIQDLAAGRLQRLIVICDSRRPLTKTAKVAQKKFEDLKQAGAIVITPAVDVLAALDALRELLSDAKSGDLDCDGETIHTEAVERWLVEHLDAKLRELNGLVFGA